MINTHACNNTEQFITIIKDGYSQGRSIPAAVELMIK